jgi:hypothetical protein
MLKGSVILWNVTKSNRQSQFYLAMCLPLLRTCLWNINPYIAFIESISIGVEPAQLAIPLINLASSIHGSILLVSKHNPVTGLAFARALSTLATDGLVFVAFEFPGAAGLAVESGRNEQLSSRGNGRMAWNLPSRTRPHHPWIIFWGIELA